MFLWYILRKFLRECLRLFWNFRITRKNFRRLFFLRAVRNFRRMFLRYFRRKFLRKWLRHFGHLRITRKNFRRLCFLRVVRDFRRMFLWYFRRKFLRKWLRHFGHLRITRKNFRRLCSLRAVRNFGWIFLWYFLWMFLREYQRLFTLVIVMSVSRYNAIIKIILGHKIFMLPKRKFRIPLNVSKKTPPRIIFIRHITSHHVRFLFHVRRVMSPYG